MREIILIPNLSGDYVVKYFKHWIENDFAYIQMELMDDNFRHILRIKDKAFNRYPKQAFSPIEYYISCEMFVDILKGVQYLHRKTEDKPRIIHRDLKPENILITYNNTNGSYLKICDFGLAVVHDRSSKSHSRGMGTTSYIAPEVKSGRKYDCKADVYSTGIIAQELFDISGDNSIRQVQFILLKLFKTFICSQQ